MLSVHPMMGHGRACLDSYQLLSLPDLHLQLASANHLSTSILRIGHIYLGKKYSGSLYRRKPLPAYSCSAFGAQFKTSALWKSEKKIKGDQKTSKTTYLQSRSLPSKDNEDMLDEFPIEDDNSSRDSDSDTLAGNRAISSPSRSAVLQACAVTSGILLALGVIIRQASHIASMEGWGIIDASTEISFDFEVWHIELIIGLVILISSLRYILLKTWPDFADSSEAANQQVLSSLQPLDYLVVAFLPGISEEFLFRGALLPLFGLDWKSALVIGAVFGSLHLGSGRRYSFAVWATFVGFAYGLTTIFSSSIIVPVASHSLNNLIGGILWRYTSSPEEKCN